MKRVLFYLSHPAHYYLFRRAMNYFNENGSIKVLIKRKDILEDLISDSDFEYENIYDKKRSGSYISTALAVLERDILVAKSVQVFKPDLIVGSGPEVAHVGKWFGIPSFLFGEDDIDIIPKSGVVSYPFAKHLVSPVSCNKGKWVKKTIQYHGYHELSYLHPNHFSPNIDVVKKWIPVNQPFFLMRFANLNAHHDKGINGLSSKVALNIIDILSKKGRVYITSEIPLETELEKYRLKIDPGDIHHILYYSNLFIGDSQSMAMEAAILGVPSIRYSDFVGKIGVLEELEHKYKLTKGITPGDIEKLLKFVELFSEEGQKNIFKTRRKEMLKDKIDFSKFMIWLLENYPKSVSIHQKDPNYQFEII